MHACRTITSSFAPCRTMRLTKAESLREGWNASRKCRLKYTVLLSSSLCNVYTGKCLYSTANHAQPIMIPPHKKSKGIWQKKDDRIYENLGNIQLILYKPSSVTYQKQILMTNLMKPHHSPQCQWNRTAWGENVIKSKLPSNLSTYNWYMHFSILCPNCAQVSDNLLPSGIVSNAVQSCRFHQISCWQLTPFCCQYVKHVWVLCHVGKSCHYAHGLLSQCIDLRKQFLSLNSWGSWQTNTETLDKMKGSALVDDSSTCTWTKKKTGQTSHKDDQMTSWRQCSCFAIVSTSTHPLFQSWLTAFIRTCCCQKKHAQNGYASYAKSDAQCSQASSEKQSTHVWRSKM